MKINEIKELRSKPAVELTRLLREKQERLRVLRFDLAAGKVKDISELRLVRKTIARLLTFLKENQKQS
ncbi:MAG: 50S ribosomal protein L29 [Patescibacteria group bacterium]